MFRYVALFACVGCSCLVAGVLPDYDQRCDAMLCMTAKIESTDYINQPVPKNVHQIWFGDHSKINKKKTDQWQAFSKKFGYSYTLWTEKDDSTLKSFMLPRNFELMLHLRHEGNYWAAADILRYELLKNLGGVYSDCDLLPPSDENGLIDLEKLVNFRGLTLMTEHSGRNIGANIALFAGNSFIVSSTHHPVISSLVDQVYDNTIHWFSKNGNTDASFCTGPFFLNKVLSGCFNLVPCTYLEKFHITDD